MKFNPLNVWNHVWNWTSDRIDARVKSKSQNQNVWSNASTYRIKIQRITTFSFSSLPNWCLKVCFKPNGRASEQHMLPPWQSGSNGQNFAITSEYELGRQKPITDKNVIDLKCRSLLCKFKSTGRVRKRSSLPLFSSRFLEFRSR